MVVCVKYRDGVARSVCIFFIRSSSVLRQCWCDIRNASRQKSRIKKEFFFLSFDWKCERVVESGEEARKKRVNSRVEEVVQEGEEVKEDAQFGRPAVE